jgi:hypothetical protein
MSDSACCAQLRKKHKFEHKLGILETKGNFSRFKRERRSTKLDRRLILGTEVRQQSDGSFHLLAAAAGQE